MKHLYDPVAACEVKSRLARLTPDSPRQWGRMNAAQAVTHMARGMEMATGAQRPLRLIDHFVAAGPAGCTTLPHSFFGRMTPDEWAVLTYKHLDHHLRQFGV